MQIEPRTPRKAMLVGACVVALFFGVFGTWAATAPLSSAAIATGQIVPEGSRRTVQHFEGGIIEELRVRDGDRVEKGDVLMVLGNARDEATHEILEDRLAELSVRRARLNATLAEAEEFRVAGPLRERAQQRPELAEMISAQRKVFETRRQTLVEHTAILEARIAQSRKRIDGLRDQIDGLNRQAALIDTEIADMQTLMDKGLARKPRLLGLQRTREELATQVAGNRSEIAATEETIGEAKIQLLNIRTRQRDEALRELSEVQSQLSEISEQLAASSDIVGRHLVRAPVTGLVVALKYKTIGGVVQAGQPILDIVPEDEALIVRARLKPTDIDAVEVGQTAKVVLSALPQRNMPQIEGELAAVSADAIEDRRTGTSYYQATVFIDASALPEDARLQPGMPAEILIETGHRTLANYLTQPVFSLVRRGMRE